MLKLSPKISFLMLSFALLTNQSVVKGVTLKCEYGSSVGYFYGTGAIYRCSITNPEIFTGTRVRIDSAVGTHTIGLTNKNVVGLHIHGSSSVNFFPRNLENVFGDLIAIAISSVNLQEIKQEDLKGFPKLQYLNIGSNKITSIDKNLFEFNPELRTIFLSSNQIAHIDPNVFDHLNHLSRLDLSGNKCKNALSKTDGSKRSDVLQVIQEVKSGKCSVTNITLPQAANEECTTKFDQVKTNLTAMIEEKSTLLKQINELEEKLREDEKMRQEIKELRVENEKLKGKCEQSTNDLILIQNTVNELKTKNEKLTKNLNEVEDKCEIKLLQSQLVQSDKMNEWKDKYINLLNTKLIESEKVVQQQNEQIKKINADDEADTKQKNKISSECLTLNYGIDQQPIILVN